MNDDVRPRRYATAAVAAAMLLMSALVGIGFALLGNIIGTLAFRLIAL